MFARPYRRQRDPAVTGGESRKRWPISRPAWVAWRQSVPAPTRLRLAKLLRRFADRRGLRTIDPRSDNGARGVSSIPDLIPDPVACARLATLCELRRGSPRRSVLSLPRGDTFASCGEGLRADRFCPYRVGTLLRVAHRVSAVVTWGRRAAIALSSGPSRAAQEPPRAPCSAPLRSR
jgi:hypothetical protein